MSIAMLVLAFGVLVVGGIIVFGMSKLQALWKNAVCICKPEHKGPCNELLDCKILKKMHADFLERRNEFWYGFCQVIVAVVIIIVLTVLVLNDKINQEAAVPVFSGLGGFVIAKSISSGKNLVMDETSSNNPSEKDEKGKN